MKLDSFIEQFKINDYRRFDEFYALTSKNVYFTALGILKDKALAEDIMQETFVSFLENVENIRPNENVNAYLSVIARNKSINLYNKNKRVEYGEDNLINVKVDGNFDSGGVEEILNLLPNADDREIITYHVVLGYKFNEIAKILNKPLGTVFWKYNKAMKLLQTKVGELYE
jgi:RNA polymerase sigma-70 factor (ECF subfamily)